MTYGTKVNGAELAYLHSECKLETEKAILCTLLEVEEGREIWIPKSLVADDSQVKRPGDAGELAAPLWFFEREGVL